MRTQDGGKTWQAAKGPQYGRVNFKAVTFSDQHIAIAVTGGFSDFGLAGDLSPAFRTEDGGVTWQPASLPPNAGASFQTMRVTGSRTAVACGGLYSV